MNGYWDVAGSVDVLQYIQPQRTGGNGWQHAATVSHVSLLLYVYIYSIYSIHMYTTDYNGIY